jgi:hypothetical protein
MITLELLQLAAKAAKYTVSFSEKMSIKCDEGTYYTDDRGFPAANRHGSCWWNPLLDDGDALRLSVDLHISVEHPNPADLGGGYVTARICKHRHRYKFLQTDWFTATPGRDECPDDLHAATRRVIVLAAAEIGKAMP